MISENIETETEHKRVMKNYQITIIEINEAEDVVGMEWVLPIGCAGSQKHDAFEVYYTFEVDDAFAKITNDIFLKAKSYFCQSYSFVTIRQIKTTVLEEPEGIRKSCTSGQYLRSIFSKETKWILVKKLIFFKGCKTFFVWTIIRHVSCHFPYPVMELSLLKLFWRRFSHIHMQNYSLDSRFKFKIQCFNIITSMHKKESGNELALMVTSSFR